MRNYFSSSQNPVPAAQVSRCSASSEQEEAALISEGYAISTTSVLERTC